MNFGKYTKSLAIVVATIISGFISAMTLNQGAISGSDLINVAILGLGAVVVYVVPNVGTGVQNYWKLIIAAVTAGLVVLNSSLAGGVSGVEWLQIIIAVLGALGVYALPNQGVKDVNVVNDGSLTD